MLLRGPGGMPDPDDIFAKAQQDFIPGVTPVEAVRVNLFPSDDSDAFPDASEEPEALPEPAKPVKAAKAKKTSRTSKTSKTAKTAKDLKTAKSSKKTKFAATVEDAPAIEEPKAVAAKPRGLGRRLRLQPLKLLKLRLARMRSPLSRQKPRR